MRPASLITSLSATTCVPTEKIKFGFWWTRSVMLLETTGCTAAGPGLSAEAILPERERAVHVEQDHFEAVNKAHRLG
jgi:hypothetical protein